MDGQLHSLEEILENNAYPGRGIMVGRSVDGDKAVIAYFIMGRSENSRNRVFVEDGDGIRTKAFDPDKLSDPSLIIYHPVRTAMGATVVTNGDQTDTITQGINEGKRFEAALTARCFEPDAPNYTPRISALVEPKDGCLDLTLSILKSDNGDPASNLRFTYSYENAASGVGRFIHTYKGDGSPLPSYEGEPTSVDLALLPVDIDGFTEHIWNALNEDNRVSLFTRFIDLKTGETVSRIVNRHQAAEA